MVVAVALLVLRGKENRQRLQAPGTERWTTSDATTTNEPVIEVARWMTVDTGTEMGHTWIRTLDEFLWTQQRPIHQPAIEAVDGY